MKLVFAGTPDFSAQALKAILAAGHQVKLVLTQPDRPSGRGMALRASPVKERALASGIEVFQPLSLKDLVAQERIREVGAEAMVVAAYGLILPQAVLDMPRFGCINIHASLLPRWRGAAPIQRAILAGDAETGVCIMQMEAGLDTGPVLLSGTLPISGAETAGSLHDKLAELGTGLIVEALAKLPLPLCPQSDSGVSYAAKIEKSEAALNWHLPADDLDRQVRAFNPAPGAFFEFDGERYKVLGADIVDGSGDPGTVLDDSLTVACGSGALRPAVVQRAGRPAMAVAELLRGKAIPAGVKLG